MTILGIETSCDETAAAVVKNGTDLLSNVVASQVDLHAVYGGVVPEVAARSHIEVMTPVIEQALADAKLGWAEIDAIAVTKGPGLIGSLLIGNLAARTLAVIKQKPLMAINHVEAHVYAAWLTNTPPRFPILGLIVSGGHTQLVLFRNHGIYDILGRTHDDAVGEAFDKVAKIIGLPYPGGPSVANAAEQGDDSVFALPKPKLGKDSLDFSFSGLKTAVLRTAQAAAGRDYRTPSHELPDLLTQTQKHDLAASFQRVAVEILIERVTTATRLYSPTSVVVAGGVAANQLLRSQLIGSLNIPVIFPPINLCTDNAAMIAARGGFAKASIASPLLLTPDPILSM